jgi:hypothetical protein
MGPFVALEVRGPSVRLDLPPELGKISPWVNVRRLKFFEQRDVDFTDFQGPVTPVRCGDGLLRYELQRIWGHRPQGQLTANVGRPVVRFDFPGCICSPMEKRVPTKTIWEAVGSWFPALRVRFFALGLRALASHSSGLTWLWRLTMCA